MTAQVALALVLLVASGLMVRSVQQLRNIDLGFDPRSTLVFGIALPERAAVSRFAMADAGQWMEAEVVPRLVARRAYDDFLHRRQDPALLEKAAGNQFTPFRLTQACLPDLTHEWGPQHRSWNGGRMDGWVSAHEAADPPGVGPAVPLSKTYEDGQPTRMPPLPPGVTLYLIRAGDSVFHGKGHCFACHGGWRLTDDKFHDIGTTTTDRGRGRELKNDEDMQFAFKTPTLR